MTALIAPRRYGIRPGHHRPIGTTTTYRFVEWDGDPPAPGDVLEQVSAAGVDDAEHVRRAYLVLGFLEGTSPERFRLLLERIEWPGTPDEGGQRFAFYNLPRRS